MSFLVIYLHQVGGVGLGVATLAVSALAIAGLAGNPAAGSLADRWGARNALAIGLVVSALGAGSMAAVRDAWQGFAAAGIVGFGAAMIWPAQDALLGSLVTAERRPRLYAVRYATMNAALGIGALGAAAIVDAGGAHTLGVVYLVDAASFLAYVPILLLGVPPRAMAKEPVAEREAGGGYGAIVRDRRFVRLWLFTALIVGVGFAQVDSAFPAFATRAGGIGASGVAIAFAANTITIVAAQLLVLRLSEGHRRISLVAAACACFALTWGLTLAAGSAVLGPGAVVGFAGAMVVFAIGEMLLSPTLPAIVNDLAPESLRGRYNGLYTLAWTTGFATGPALAGPPLASGHATALFVGLIAGCAIAALAATRLTPRRSAELASPRRASTLLSSQ